MALAQPDRYGAALVSVAVAVLLCGAARLRPGDWTTVVARVMGVALVLNLVTWQAVVIHGGTWNASGDLMVDLCPLANVVTAIALWNPRPLLVELSYFWACAGTIQGILQPDQRWRFPSYFYFEFYGDHSGAVIGALFLVVGLRLAPRPHAVRRVFAFTIAFACVAAVVDVLTGGNYLFLRDKGPAGTLLDLMGPWPWYIGTAAVIALVLFLLLDAPFRAARARSPSDQSASGRTGAMTASGLDLQSTPGTSMNSSISLPSGSRM
jgi:hypothetical integral membrane protein (TIGR02206 family)